MSAQRPTYRQTLRWLAFDNHGIVTTKQAAGVGVPAVELRKLAARGALDHLAYGVYRMTEAPTSPYQEQAIALAIAGDGAALADESVLALHQLALVNPRVVKVVSPKRRRASASERVHIARCAGPIRTEQFEGLTTMVLAEAILGCQGRVITDRLLAATESAQARGLISLEDARDTFHALKAA